MDFHDDGLLSKLFSVPLMGTRSCTCLDLVGQTGLPGVIEISSGLSCIRYFPLIFFSDLDFDPDVNIHGKMCVSINYRFKHIEWSGKSIWSLNIRRGVIKVSAWQLVILMKLNM